MKAIVDKKRLLAELTWLNSVTEKKNTIPVLSNFLIDADLDGLTISATDLDVSARVTLPATITAFGAFCAPAKKLFEFVKSLPNGDVEISWKDDAVTTKLEKSKQKLGTIPKTDFPELDFGTGLEYLSLPASTLERMLTYVQHAITNNESRYALSAAKLEIKNQKMLLTTTDGHRLAHARTRDGLLPEEVNIDLLLPRKGLRVLVELVTGRDKVDFAYSENQACFQVKQDALTRKLAMRLSTGTFPNYQIVLLKPADIAYRAHVNSAAFAASLKRVALAANERLRSVKLTFGPDSLDLFAQSTDTGEAEDSIAVQYRGDTPASAPATPIVIGFNADYLSDVCPLLGDTIEIQLKDANSQIGMVRFMTDPQDYEFIETVMSMRLS